jgi:RecA/RadA recombinase
MTKTAPKKRTVKKPASSAVFSLLTGDNDIQAAAMESLHAMRAARKNDATTLRSLNQIKRNGIPIDHFYMQYALGLSYLPSRCGIEVIGGEGLGKSTLIFTLLGMAARANVPSMYEECEGKPMLEHQIRRCLSADAAQAKLIFERAVKIADGREITQAIKDVEEWIFDLRGCSVRNKVPRLPAENPIVVAIDTWSKLMSPGQAAGYMDHGDNMKPEVAKNKKETGEGSNFEHAKLAAWWTRRWPYLLSNNNVLLLTVAHQNPKIDMGGTSKMSADAGALYNKTKIGGAAFNQSCAIQIILKKMGQAKNGSGEVTGTLVRFRVDKNSFGPTNRVMDYELRNVYSEDTAVYHEPAIQLDAAMAKWFADTRILNTTADRKRYTCEALGVIGGTPEDLSKALHSNMPMMTKLAMDLSIHGYDETTELPVFDPRVTPPAPPTPEELSDAEEQNDTSAA